ncbi:8005_t:CDS:2 [Cetraspora pellucida]|uniref:8005_t:CDS:1 n=1 Tax=Cetraspora pellucida TaxID=1433469 RepID=A0A9N8Z8X7_9GLOM|nr:8005_t:CDS:2 [Cetraspora pellucida]
MASQPDFIVQKLAIVELIEGADNCNYTWAGLQQTVPYILDSVDIITIRKFAQKLWRYMELYHEGLTGKLAEYVCKKFKSHRRIPKNELALFIQENNDKAYNNNKRS